jgi:hypothetical protein
LEIFNGTCSKNSSCSLCGNGHKTGVGCRPVYQFLQPPIQTVPGKAASRRDEFLGCGHAWRDRAAASASLRDQQTGSPADIRVVRKGQTQFGFNFFRASGESNCLSSSEGRMGVCLPRDHLPTGRSILEQLICGAHARPIAGRPLIGAAPATAWRRRYEGAATLQCSALADLRCARTANISHRPGSLRHCFPGSDSGVSFGNQLRVPATW